MIFSPSPKPYPEKIVFSSNFQSAYRRHLPTTSSRMSFHCNSDVCSWTTVIRIRLWIPWCSKNKPLQGNSSLWSTTHGMYSPFWPRIRKNIISFQRIRYLQIFKKSPTLTQFTDFKPHQNIVFGVYLRSAWRRK